ncbi:MAG: GNAT family N-acetyltransferase [Actinomycetota bacterium]
MTESLFQSESWRQAVEQSFDVKILEYAPVTEPEGVGYYAVLSDLRGDRVVSTPFSDVCDPVLHTAEGWREFADHLRSFDLPVTIRPFEHANALADDRFEHRRELLWHGVDLTAGGDAIWDGLKSKMRTAIRRAPKQGITFRFSSAMADVETFHAMHVRLRKSKYRMLAQPLSFFAALNDRFGDRMAVLLAEDADGDPVAAMVFFAWDGIWYYKFSASYERSYRPNSAMLMAACREGADRGLSLMDMGRSDKDQPGLIDFKRTFASEERELATLHWAPEDHDDQAGAEASRTLGAMTALLTDPSVPDEVTADSGALLYKFFG